MSHASIEKIFMWTEKEILESNWNESAGRPKEGKLGNKVTRGRWHLQVRYLAHQHNDRCMS
jgi:hypothetical protein